MKIICSEGGPLIGLDRRIVGQWSGVFGKRFIGDNSTFTSDYEAVCYLGDGRHNPVANISKFVNSRADGLVVTMPVETFIVSQSASSILIAQIEAANDGWSESSVSSDDFDRASFSQDRSFVISIENAEFMFFDAAYDADMIGDDYISVMFSAGNYRVSDALLIENSVELNLFKIERI